MKNKKTRVEILSEFYAAPEETLFNQDTLCAVVNCSTSLAERNRWSGCGAPFIKIGNAVRYLKSDILNYIGQHKACNSTSALQSMVTEGVNNV